MLDISPSLLAKPFTMARTSKPIAAPSCPTRGETAILEFARSSLTPEQLKQRAAPLLNDMELLRDVWALTPEDQTKFVDKVDQVGQGGSFFSLKILPTLLLPRHIQPSTRKMRNS